MINPLLLAGKFLLPDFDVKAALRKEGEAFVKEQLGAEFRRLLNRKDKAIAAKMLKEGWEEGKPAGGKKRTAQPGSTLPDQLTRWDVVRDALYRVWDVGVGTPGEISDILRDSYDDKVYLALEGQTFPDQEALVKAVADAQAEIIF